MLNKFKAMIGASVITVAMMSNAAHAETATATANAEILAAVELSPIADLDMGLVAVGAQAGTVTLEASGTRTCSAELTCVGTATPGSFQVTNATDGFVIDITVDATTTLSGTGGDDMTLTLNPDATSITFDSAALQTISVGGILAVNASQGAGVYTGTYNVSADYQ